MRLSCRDFIEGKMGKGKAKVRLPTGRLWPCKLANIRLSCRDFIEGKVKSPTLNAGKGKTPLR
jgi:hypothetical protein